MGVPKAAKGKVTKGDIQDAINNVLDNCGDNDDDDDDDDEFFGSQEETMTNADNDEYDHNNNPNKGGFGNLGMHEIRSRNQRLQTASYLDAFEASKEELLQEGFEAGFLESFEAGRTLGNLVGRISTDGRLQQRKEKENRNEPSVATDVMATTTDTSRQRALESVHDFFSKEFQSSDRVPEALAASLARLVVDTKKCLNDMDENKTA